MKEVIYVKATQILKLIEDAESKIEKMYEETLFVCASSVGHGYVVLSVSDIEHLYV